MTNNFSGQAPVKYRALYEFVARSEDELSLQPGDTVLVFEDHASEPGWLAGQIREKVGWFPAAFAEPAAKKTSPSAAPSSTPASPSAEPLASIKEEPTEKEQPSEPALTSPASAAPAAPAQPAGLLYDAPPGDSPEKPEPSSALGDSADAVLELGVAQFPWKARNSSDLSFAKGDLIEVLEKTEMRWRGRVKGQPGTTGWFPKSYVKVSANGTGWCYV